MVAALELPNWSGKAAGAIAGVAVSAVPEQSLLANAAVATSSVQMPEHKPFTTNVVASERQMSNEVAAAPQVVLPLDCTMRMRNEPTPAGIAW